MRLRLACALVGTTLMMAGCHDNVDGAPGTETATTDLDTRIDTISFEDVTADSGVTDDTGTSPDTTVVDTLDGDTLVDDTVVDDTVNADTAMDVDDTTADGVADTSEPADTTLEDTSPPPTVNWGFVCDDAGGEGCLCGDGESCALGLTCAETALGSVCVEPCVTTCAGDRRCARAATGFNICLPAGEMLCTPCAVDADCLELGSACVDFGFPGSFCATRCAVDSVGSAGCPEGFSCFALGAGQARQCLPDSGDCECSGTATALGATTACFAAGANACTGSRTCEVDGLSVCDARQPSDEACNGIDDDCDGDTDEGFDVGAACAETVDGCANGQLVCAADGLGTECMGATSGQSEICNNIDDDCNGTTDEGCDDDGDDFCDAAMGFTESDACPLGGDDCDDGAAGVNPGVLVEACNNIDDDCNTSTDEGCDNDGDDYCDAALALTTSDACPLGGGDCEDGDGNVHPNQPELCDNVDNDCNGTTDGFSQACTNACGPGTTTCTAGVEGACSGPGQLCNPSDPCCAASGCAYQPNTLQCKATPDSTERRCSGSCGGTVQKRDLFRRCTGSSATCGTGNRVWSGWSNQQGCGASNLCTASGTNASCTSCPMGCASGACITQPTHRICIDPGYGAGTGPVHGGVAGRDVTWSVANHLKNWLNADTNKPQGGGTWAVTLTRTASNNPASSTRRTTCNNANATRVISIGVNGFNGSVRGTETYRKSTSNGTWVAYANQVQAQVLAKGGLPDRGVKVGTFTILSTNAPSAQTYLGFLDNATDRASMASDSWRREVAKGLLHAIQQSMGYPAYTP